VRVSQAFGNLQTVLIRTSKKEDFKEKSENFKKTSKAPINCVAFLGRQEVTGWRDENGSQAVDLLQRRVGRILMGACRGLSLMGVCRGISLKRGNDGKYETA